MKKITLCLFISALALTGFSQTPATKDVSHADQVAPTTAIITSDYVLTVPSATPLGDYYTIDVSSMQFDSPEQLYTYFSGFNDNVVEFQVNRNTKTVHMHVRPEYISQGKTVEDLNTYFSGRSASMREAYNNRAMMNTVPVPVQQDAAGQDQIK